MINVTAIGRIGTIGSKESRETEMSLKTSPQTGTQYAQFSLAVNEGPRDSEKTTWLKCVAFNGIAQRLVKAKAKVGSALLITGRLSITEWTNPESGVKVTTPEVQVTDWSYLPTNRPKDAGEGSATETAQKTAPAVDEDDDLPF